MSEPVLQKSDLSAVFKRLRSIPTNKVCFDCNAKNPTWASVTYGVFLCIDCSAVHRSLGVHLTFVRSTQLDTNWTWPQLRNMQLGGNANACKFFVQHSCTTTDAQQKYKSRVAQLYRDKLHNLTVQATKLHGYQLFIDDESSKAAESQSAAEVDFFDEHADSEFRQLAPAEDQDDSLKLAHLSLGESAPVPAAAGDTSGPAARGPCVDALLGGGARTNAPVPTGVSAVGSGPRRSMLGQKRAGVGGRKLGGGMGAAKVTGTDFSEFERQAERSDKMKAETAIQKEKQKKVSAEEQAQNLASMRLAYKDLGTEQAKQSQKLASLDPKKAEQAERLGMGFARQGGVSHSAFNDMTTIEQSGPASSRSDRLDDLLGRSKRSGFFDRSDRDASDEDLGYAPKKTTTDDDDEDFFTAMTSSSGQKNGANSWSRDDDGWGHSVTSNQAKQSSTRRDADRKSLANDACGDEAQKKFGGAKAISSDAYFGNDRDDFQSMDNTNRFQGASSISSADYFGRSSDRSPRSGGTLVQAPDLDDVKESVRVGVTKVAGRLSNIASGVMSSIQ